MRMGALRLFPVGCELVGAVAVSRDQSDAVSCNERDGWHAVVVLAYGTGDSKAVRTQRHFQCLLEVNECDTIQHTVTHRKYSQYLQRRRLGGPATRTYHLPTLVKGTGKATRAGDGGK